VIEEEMTKTYRCLQFWHSCLSIAACKIN